MSLSDKINKNSVLLPRDVKQFIKDLLRCFPVDDGLYNGKFAINVIKKLAGEGLVGRV